MFRSGSKIRKLSAAAIMAAGIMIAVAMMSGSGRKEVFAAENNPTPFVTPTPEIPRVRPTLGQSRTLVKNTVADFADAIESANFDTFRNNASSHFNDQYTEADLKSVYKQFIELKEDVLPILRQAVTMNPKFSPVPSLRKEKGYSIWVTKGKFDTKPVPVKFYNEYVYQDGEWKLLKIHIDL